VIVLANRFAWREYLRSTEISARCNLSADLRSTPAGLPNDLFEAGALTGNFSLHFYHSSCVEPLDTGFADHRTV